MKWNYEQPRRRCKSALDDPMNELVWTVANADIEDETQYATIEKRANRYYLSAKEVGFTIVTVKNLRGTVAKSFNVHVYDEGVILLNMRTASSLGIESNRYIGQYDFGSTTQKEASFALDIDIYPENLKEQIVIKIFLVVLPLQVVALQLMMFRQK